MSNSFPQFFANGSTSPQVYEFFNPEEHVEFFDTPQNNGLEHPSYHGYYTPNPVSQGDPSVTNQPSNIGYNLAVISPELRTLDERLEMNGGNFECPAFFGSTSTVCLSQYQAQRQCTRSLWPLPSAGSQRSFVKAKLEKSEEKLTVVIGSTSEGATRNILKLTLGLRPKTCTEAKDADTFHCVVGACRQLMQSLDEFKEHIKTSHNIKNSHSENQPMPCVVNDCTKQMQAGALMRHIVSHVQALRLRCTFCQSTFSRRDSLNRHIELKHPAHS